MTGDCQEEGAILLCGSAPRENVDDGPQTCCEKCGNELCPKCGGHCSQGYGFAYGGIGTYTACNECDYFYKVQDQPE